MMRRYCVRCDRKRSWLDYHFGALWLCWRCDGPSYPKVACGNPKGPEEPL